MKVTMTKDPREPESTVAIMINDDSLAVVGPAGWLDQANLPDHVYWETNGLGVRLYDQNGAKIGDAGSDSISDFQKGYDRIFLLTFNDKKAEYTQHGPRPLSAK